MGTDRGEPELQESLHWLKAREGADGLWALRIVRGRDKDSLLWVSFAISRVFKRLYGGDTGT